MDLLSRVLQFPTRDIPMYYSWKPVIWEEPVQKSTKIIVKMTVCLIFFVSSDYIKYTFEILTQMLKNRNIFLKHESALMLTNCEMLGLTI